MWTSDGLEVRSTTVPVRISPAGDGTTAETVHRACYELGFETPERALRILDDSLPATSERSEIHSLRGCALEVLGRLEEARDAYRTALELTAEPSPQPAERVR